MNYDLGYLLTPLLPEDQAVELVETQLKGAITARGGTIRNDGRPKMIALAYPIKKTIEHKTTTFRDAYFGHFYFDLTTEKIGEVEEILKHLPEMVRYLLLARGEAPAPEVRPAPRPMTTPVKSSMPAPIMPVAPSKKSMTREAMDKEIEGLLTT